MIKLVQEIFINFVSFCHTLAISAINQTILTINIMSFSFLNRIKPPTAILRAFLDFNITCINMFKIFRESYLLIKKMAILFLAFHFQKISLGKLYFSDDSGFLFIVAARWTDFLPLVFLLVFDGTIFALYSDFTLLAYNRFMCKFLA